MDDEIKAIPSIPAGLKEAAQRGILIPFIGAGASRIAGCPSWLEFADLALGCVVDGEGLSHAQLEQLKHLGPRVKLSIARSLAKEHEINIDYPDIIAPSDGYDNSDGRRLYGLAAVQERKL